MALLPINLPSGFSPKVSVDDKVAEGEVIARKEGDSNLKIIDLPHSLGIKPKDVLRVLAKRPGDRISKGELIAFKKGFLKGKKSLESPFSGTISKIEEESGRLHILTGESGDSEEIRSPVDGEITFCDNEKIVIKTETQALSLKEGFGENVGGELTEIKGEKIDIDTVKGNLENKILYGNSFERAAISKALGLGAKAVLAGELRDEDYRYFEEKKLGPVAVVDKESVDKLREEVGKEIYLDLEKKVILKI